MPEKKELLLCSIGLKPEHITFETIREARKCGALFSDYADVPLLHQLLPRITGFGPNHNFLSAEQKAAIVMAAFKKCNRVGLMIYGHPGFLCHIAEELRELCATRKIKVRMLDAISSCGMVQIAAGLRGPGREGVFSISALAVVHNSALLHPGSHVFIYDIVAFSKKSALAQKETFGHYILSVYPKGHKLLLIDCEGITPERKLEFTVTEFEKAVSAATVYSTLYIPPLAKPARARRAA
jgi:hypothetical protein